MSCVSRQDGWGQSVNRLSDPYFEMEFGRVVSLADSIGTQNLTQPEEITLIKAFARMGQIEQAESHASRISGNDGIHENQLALCRGIIHLSSGRFETSLAILDSIVYSTEDCETVLTRDLAQLYTGTHNGIVDSGVFECIESDLLLEMSREICYSTRDVKQIRKFLEWVYEVDSEDSESRKQPDRRKLEKTLDMLDELGESTRLYDPKFNGDRVELQLIRWRDDWPHRCIIYESGNTGYRVLLDTGNSIGWAVFDHHLRNEVADATGAGVSIASGMMERPLSGRQIITNELNFGNVVINSMTGAWFRKPSGEFVDAAFNPVFLTDVVTTIDFANDRFVLRTKSRFDDDALDERGNIWYYPMLGYHQPLMDVTVADSNPAVAMIETGASHTHITKDFADRIGLRYSPVIHDAGDGEPRRYLIAETTVCIERICFVNGSIEVVPSEIRDPLTGFSPDVIIGADIFDGRFAISFDPFDRLIVIHRR